MIHGAFSSAALALAVVATCLFGFGCTPAIGDRCALSTDCSIQGTRLCDTSQPGGYCTMLRCTANACPENAACVEFGASVPGCPYDDYSAPSRVGRAMCLKTCGSNADCRQTEGYICADPLRRPDPKAPTLWIAILDTDQSKKVCMIAAPSASFVDAAVCSSSRSDAPPFEASVPVGSGSDGAADDGEGGTGVGVDGAVDAEASEAAMGEAGADALGDAQSDATLDAAAESGTPDAPGSSE
jgi:hypothetical protein